MSPMLGPQTANREKKSPKKVNFDFWGYVVGLVALTALLYFFGIRYAVDQFSILCILKEMTQGE